MTEGLSGPFCIYIGFTGASPPPALPPMATFPTLHLNGTGKNDLRDGYADAYDAIDKAIEALANAELNGRDFYPQGPGAYSQALSLLALPPVPRVRQCVHSFRMVAMPNQGPCFYTGGK